MYKRRIPNFFVKVLVILACLFLFGYLLAWALTGLLKTKLPEVIAAQTGRTAAIKDVKLDLWPLLVEVDGFELKEKNADALFVSVGRFVAQVDVLDSLANYSPVLKNIRIEKPVVHIAKHKDGAFNFSDLGSTESKTIPKPEAGEGFDITLGQFLVSDGLLVWEDRSGVQPTKLTIEPVQIAVDGFSTGAGRSPAQIKLLATLASGGQLGLTASLAVKSGQGQGQLKLDGLALKSLLSAAGIDYINGKVSVAADFQINLADDKLTVKTEKTKIGITEFSYGSAGQILKAADFSYETDLEFSQKAGNWLLEAKQANIEASNLQMQDKLIGKIGQVTVKMAYQLTNAGKQINLTIKQGALTGQNIELSERERPLLAMPALDVNGIDFDLGAKKLKLSTASLKNADIKAWLNADGSLNYQTLFSSTDNSEEDKAVAASKPAEPWAVNIDSVVLADCAVELVDQTFAKPVTTLFKPIDIKLNDYSNRNGVNLPVEFSVGINKTGTVSVNGTASITSIAAKLELAVKNIDLEKFQPYFDPFINLDVIDGMLNLDGTVTVNEKIKGSLAIKFNGNGSIADFLTRDRRVHKDLVKWRNLSLTDIGIALPDNRYTAKLLNIDQPYARVTIRKDKTINFSDILVAKQGTSKTQATQSETKQLRFKLDKIQVTNGTSDFTDLSLILPFAAHVKGLGGGALGISSETNSSVNVSLKGNAYDLAPVDISGKIKPFLGDYTVEVNFNGLPMPLVSPYMVQFAGYKVEKGKMSLALKYELANKRLVASNKLLIDQFELGEKIDNPDAVALPLKLAVALLKDGSGKIKFDVPITGSLEDPQFSIGAIIREAMVNALGKIITSPFAALASLTGGEKDFSTINFAPGSANLDKQQDSKLSEIAKALRERPGLALEIKGAAFQGPDWPAISDDALYDQLKMRRATEINKEGGVKTRPEYVELSKEDYQRLLADMFIEKFPLLADKSVFGVPHLKDNAGKGEFYETAKQKLMEVIKPEPERLKDLAAARAQAIAKYLVKQGAVPHERVYILDSQVDQASNDKEIVSYLALTSD